MFERLVVMLNKLSLLTLIAFLLVSCTDDELPIITKGEGMPLNLVGQNQTLSVCGGNYILTSANSDTILVKYNSVLRDFFVNNHLSEEDFPLAVSVTLKRLDKSDPCCLILKEVEHIGISYLRE